MIISKATVSVTPIELLVQWIKYKLNDGVTETLEVTNKQTTLPPRK